MPVAIGSYFGKSLHDSHTPAWRRALVATDGTDEHRYFRTKHQTIKPILSIGYHLFTGP